MNKQEKDQKIKKVITKLNKTSIVQELVFNRNKTIKRIMDLQKILWIPIHRDEKPYFEVMDDTELKRQLSMHEFAYANPK